MTISLPIASQLQSLPLLAAASWLASSILFAPVSGRAPPRHTMQPTATRDFQSWPLRPTLAPDFPADPWRRDLNTICGYIGGNRDLPATCLAGSHCAVDVEHKAIGCCPNQGDCTTGIFTGCVDASNPGHGVVDPHIFTCGAGDVCYKNTFEGGFFQYGCGSNANVATTVALSASGEAVLTLMSVSVSLRPTTTLALVTTSSSGGGSSGRGPGSTSSSNHEGVNRTSIIVGAVIGGLAALILVLALAFWLWRRSKKSPIPEAEEEPKFIRQAPLSIKTTESQLLTGSSRPLASPGTEFDGADDMTDARPAPRPPAPGERPDDTESWPIPPTTNKGAVIGVATTTGDDTDRTPLTQENILAPTNNIENFSPVETGSVPRRGGERPFWQQTGGGRTRNLTRS